jgi:predicted phosphodiesterase
VKTIFLGDTHGRNIWKQIIAKENPDRVVFIGDYFDSFDITPVEQIHNFKEIIAFKETNVMEVIMLIGNHDFHYYPGGETYSGYKAGVAPTIRQLLEENKHHLQMCYQLDNILCSHAGIGYDWLMEQNRYEELTNETISDFVNEVWKHHPRYFMFNGIDPYGNSLTQTPIWIRPVALMSGNKDTFLKKDYIQVVGHTQVKTIDMGQATGGRYYFIDALEVGEYLIYENEIFIKGSFKS